MENEDIGIAIIKKMLKEELAAIQQEQQIDPALANSSIYKELMSAGGMIRFSTSDGTRIFDAELGKDGKITIYTIRTQRQDAIPIGSPQDLLQFEKNLGLERGLTTNLILPNKKF